MTQQTKCILPDRILFTGEDELGKLAAPAGLEPATTRFLFNTHWSNKITAGRSTSSEEEWKTLS